MDERTRARISKFLSLVLRHRPDTIGIALDREGWVAVDTLLAGCRVHGHDITRALLDDVVATNPKRRFAFSEDGSRIRANQGHSVEVELGYRPQQPPDVLFHGTIADFLPAIRAEGLCKMRRHHVHLSPDAATAAVVGRRRGAPVVLRVLAGRMHGDGHVFFLSDNGVWLTDTVAPRYIDFPAP
jgi:putative RNA 2'-phosphotransferase